MAEFCFPVQDVTPKISSHPRVAIYFPEVTEVDVFFAIIQTELQVGRLADFIFLNVNSQFSSSRLKSSPYPLISLTYVKQITLLKKNIPFTVAHTYITHIWQYILSVIVLEES